MGIISWIILGLIAGALAKWLMPGDDGGGWIATMVLGIAGAFVGGFLGGFLGFGGADGVNIGSIVTATLGAFILLFLYNRFIRS
ncbi:GlsB/YeaQ/YmgE family stress response membrane protein [Vibrio taketomensis]|uniref:GlsB/YeaQ/YmgE family stress response membrane protein n=1 Tax=Vibrio taketomensis TaxID=2572923 RepID=UPI0013898BBF|nr:GlsB/YeaQ/YmgE family stress response membrane protein [Vibrio taketomensis]